MQLSRLIRMVQSKGIYLQPSLVQLAGWRLGRGFTEWRVQDCGKGRGLGT